MAARKLEREIDRTLNKVSEGVELFESIYDKMQASTNQTQKEKLEKDLKTQIKKLQRLRDLIKTWIANNDIKDKTALLQNRRLIETQLEKFKACEREMKTEREMQAEREMKTKAFSKEVLIQSAKLEQILWLQACAEELLLQVESAEEEIETLQQGGRKRGKIGAISQSRLEKLERLNGRRKWHISRLEIMLKLLNNGTLSTEQVLGLKDDVNYFIEDNENDDHDEDEGIYDDLNLDEEEEKFGRSNFAPQPMSSILKAGLPTVQPRPPLKYATAAAAVTPSASQQGNVSTPATAPSLLGADNQLRHLRDQLSQWLSPSDPSINHNVACEAHHSGTAQWFNQTRISEQWKSTGSLLWIHGKPGSGKTVLCSWIIQDIIAPLSPPLGFSGPLIAYFYFDFRDDNKQGLCNLLPSLLCQLSAQFDPFCDILSQLYSAHDHGAQRPSNHAMVKCLEEMFTFTQQPIYIILDALDECPNLAFIPLPSPRDELLKFVVRLVNLHLPNLRICVTSRLEHDIRVVLEPLTPHSMTLHDERGQQQDITNYVTSFVYTNKWMRRWREDDRNFVVKRLSETADGMFRRTFSVLERLQRCLPPNIRRILDELPESLDETYEGILREIIRRPNQEHARQLLRCLAAAVRPLRVEELAEILAFNFNAGRIPKLNPGWRWEDAEEAVMSACPSLVIIVKDGDSRIVQFSHFSVKEFLTSSRLAGPIRDISRYHIQHHAAHATLARACLGSLLLFDDRVDRDNIEEFPLNLARYAAQYWVTHARVAGASSSIKDHVECLFDADKPYFSAWLWIYNEDRGGRSMSTVRPMKPEAVPLYYAARLGFQDLAKHLIAEHPEHVYARGGKETTPMHAAALGGHVDILRLLQEHGADVVGSRNKHGETPLHGASWSGKLDAGQFLLDLGADINPRNEDDWTPLFHAIFHGHTEFARMLLERGATVEARSVFGSTPLHAAVRGGKIQAVRLLLERGADIHARDSRGWTPYQWKSTLEKEMVELLAAYGAEFGK